MLVSARRGVCATAPAVALSRQRPPLFLCSASQQRAHKNGTNISSGSGARRLRIAQGAYSYQPSILPGGLAGKNVYSVLQQRGHSNIPEEAWLDSSPTQKVGITFIQKDGVRKSVNAPVGTSLLDVAHHYGVEVEGACEASLACSTCHVIVDEKSFKKLPEASEREDDLLDMAPHLTETSRLSCQVILTPELEGMNVTLPPSTLNFYVDGHVPSTH